MSNIVQNVMYTALTENEPGYEKLASRLVEKWPTSRLVPMPESLLHQLYVMGQFYDTKEVLMFSGSRNQCHTNAAFYVAEHSEYELHTGYALSGGLWRQHSWAWHPGKQRIVETTEPRDMYFGLRDPDEKKNIAALNNAVENHERKRRHTLPGLPA